MDDIDNFEQIVEPEAVEQEDVGPYYRVLGESRIPVSKHRGKLWKSRLEASSSRMRKYKEAWDETIRYYKHDQTRGNRVEDGDRTVRKAKPEDTENIVFANVSALVPMLYAKNPDSEFSTDNEATKPLANTLEALIKLLMNSKSATGMSMKRKAKRAIVLAVLCNLAWFEVGYTRREESSDAALEEITRLSEELQNAKSQKEIKEIEGKLMALEEKIDLLNPSGPWCKLRMPWQVHIDPNTTELDLVDSNWMIVEDMVSTMYLRAVYGKKKDGSEEYESMFEPTHVLKLGATASSDKEDLSSGFSLFDKSPSKDHTAYGYDNEYSFRAAQMSHVYYVWDKVTRRIELYSAASWEYPIWVWDDPYKLDQFFPLTPLDFHLDPTALYARGEVSYYLDQQDSINNINGELSRIRFHLMKLIAYNKTALKDPSTLDAMLNGTLDARAVGFDVNEGEDLSKMFRPLLPVSAEHAVFLDKKPLLESIDRLSGVASVQRGVEYKTNTTNRAIESYEAQIQTRADDKMDSIEEALGNVAWLTAQMCLQFMSAEDIGALLGEEHAKNWKNLSREEIRLAFRPRVIGGSSMKPTARAKKEQAMQLMQLLGQFASATPVALVIAIDILRNAFTNEISITEQQWQVLGQAIVQRMKAEDAGAGGGASGAEGGQPPQGGQPQGGEAPSLDGIVGLVQQAGALIDQMPAELKEQIGVMLARGNSVEDIVANLIQTIQQGAG